MSVQNNGGRLEFCLNPKRQEMDWKELWPVFGWAYILVGTSILLFVSSMETSRDRAWAFWGFIVGGSLCMLFGIGLLVPPFIQYLANFVSWRKSSKAQIRFAVEEDSLLLYADGAKVIKADFSRIDYVAAMTSQGRFLDTRAGFGFRFHDLDSVCCAQEHSRKAMEKTLAAKGFHLWIPSSYVGSQAQNEDLRCWLFTTPLSDRIHQLENESASLVGWNRELWFIFAFVTFGLIGAILYYLI